MLRITHLKGSPGAVKVEGHLAGPNVGEFLQVATLVLAEGIPLHVDVSDLTFVDQDGVVVLRSLTGRGARLIGCSEFVRTLMTGGTR